LIITTNAGAQAAEKNQIGFATSENTYSDADLKKFFAPEFRNRLDAVVTFKKLTKETMIKVVGKFMLEVKEQVKEKGIRIKLSNEAIDWLIEKGFDPKMGARPLHRIIDKEIKRPLAKQMLFGELTNGGAVTITVVDGKLDLQAKAKVKKETTQHETPTEHTD
jgi:ATP-dependent Clp protease ATP-binding subunit ClpA